MRLARAGFFSIAFAFLAMVTAAVGGEPDPKTYWNVDQVRPGMKGTGRTVMVGTKLEEFGAEVLGVLKDVNPGRDMILCRLTGIGLEHAGIIQGMSGSPIYIDGKLLGAVAYAWEFAKDPIAGVTPFEQMVKYVRSNDRRLAAEPNADAIASRLGGVSPFLFASEAQGDGGGFGRVGPIELPRNVSAGGLVGMRPIVTPLSATGFHPRALGVLQTGLGSIGLAPVSGGGVMEEIRKREGDKPLVPGSPLTIGMVLGDFDISGIGTVTHVERDRVYGFGHPMLGLGPCEFPMMTGYIHTVYPRASVSMKMGSPLNVVGTLDTDVSTGIAGRIGRMPDLVPMTVRVRTSPLSDPRKYNVRIVRNPKLLPTLALSVLTNAIDTEGDFPEELTARITATLKAEGLDPIVIHDVASGPRYSGPMGPSAVFAPVSALVGILSRNAFQELRIESIDCDVDLEPVRSTAAIESIRLVSDRLRPGETLKVLATLKPYKAAEQVFQIEQVLPDSFPEGTYDVTLCDASSSLRRRLVGAPHLSDPHSLAALLEFLKFQIALERTNLFLHVPRNERGLAVAGQSLANLPASVRVVLSDSRQTAPTVIRPDEITALSTPFVVEGSQTLKFKVVKDADRFAAED